MTSAAKEYAKRGAPTEIMHGEYAGRLVDVQPLQDGFVCGIYHFEGGTCCDGPMINIWEGRQTNEVQTHV